MLSQPQAGLPSLRFDDLITPFFAFLAQRPAHQALVIHHQDFVGSHAECVYFSALPQAAWEEFPRSVSPAGATRPHISQYGKGLHGSAA
jgi:hypothetical protein